MEARIAWRRRRWREADRSETHPKGEITGGSNGPPGRERHQGASAGLQGGRQLLRQRERQIHSGAGGEENDVPHVDTEVLCHIYVDAHEDRTTSI